MKGKITAALKQDVLLLYLKNKPVVFNRLQNIRFFLHEYVKKTVKKAFGD